MAEYAQMQQIVNARDAQQMNALKMQEAQATMEERNALRRLDPTSADYEAQLFRLNPQLGISYRKEAAATGASKAAQKTSEFNLTAAKSKFIDDAKRNLSSNPSDATVVSWGEDAVIQGLYTQPQADATVAHLLSLPLDQRARTLSMAGASASELKPTLTPQNLGGTVRVLSTPAFGGTATPVAGSTAATTMTPFQAEDLKVKQGQLRVAQDRLAAEAATGVLSPDSQELAANLYLTTGTLPPMGIGKGGAALKASIMNRAAEISKAGGATPAAGAANIIAAKQDVGTQTKALKDFSTGVQGQMVTSFNTAIDHLGTMDKLVDALNNGDIKAFNSLGNAVARQTGAPAPTNFDTARHIVGAEIQKAIIRAGGTGKEREEAANAFANAGSPAQLKGVIDTYKQLLGGQLNSLEMQYTANTGRKDFKKLSPTAQETVRKLRGEGSTAPAGGVDTRNPLLQTTP